MMSSSSRPLGWRPGAVAGTLDWAGPTPRVAAALLAAILILAAALRLHGLPHDLPYSYFTDEMTFVNRAMAMGAGDLNPHWFNKPGFLMYLLLAAYGAYFAVGWLVGQFASPEAFGAYFLNGTGPFVLIGRLVVLAFGIAAVWAAYLVARRAFGSVAGALCAALVSAVLLPMVVGSYLIKADVPAGLFVTLSVWAYLRARDDPGLGPVLLAGAFAGLSMGTKYYGVIVLPVFGVAELLRPFGIGAPARTPWPRVFLRGALMGVAFVAAFFAVSPYNFLDPVFATRMSGWIGDFLAADETLEYAVDSGVEYDAGLGAVPGALAFAFGRLLEWDALTWPLSVLAGLGVAVTLARRETRWAAFILAGPCVVFLLLAGSIGAYHTDARHLNAVFPVLAAFVFPGALLVARALGLWRRDRAAAGLAATLVLAAATPTAYLTVQENLRRLRPDSRTVAVDWIEANLPRDELILHDHFGPVLPIGPATVARQRARLEELRAYQVGAFDAFTAPEEQRLALLERHPDEDGFTIERLGHPWWSPRELSEEELLSNPEHRRVSNPLVSRVPKTLEEYREAGVRYIVTNTIAECQYEIPNAAENFPSFVRFYGELRRLEPLHAIDPRTWGGKGPVVYIYDLGTPDDPAPAADSARPAPDCEPVPGVWPGDYAGEGGGGGGRDEEGGGARVAALGG